MIQIHPSRAKALKQLNSFVETYLALYARDRNFDFGPDKRTNTSCLSPYVTHGVLSEKEVIQKAIKKFPFSKIEKFIQESFGDLLERLVRERPWIMDGFCK